MGILLLDLVYFAVAANLAAAAVVLRASLKETVWLRLLDQEIASAVPRDRLAAGTPVPQFAASLLDTSDNITADELRRRASALLFVAPEDGPEARAHLRRSFHALWHRAKARLYVVCSGNIDQCRQLRDELTPVIREKIPILLDEDLQIRRVFRVQRSPTAVELDDTGRVLKYGTQMSADEIRAREHMVRAAKPQSPGGADRGGGHHV